MNAAAVYSCGCGCSFAAGQCLNALKKAGVQVRNQAAARRRSILLFSEPGEEVCRLLRETCGGGRNRVLAVGLSRQLRPGETDSLLADGAADVLIWREGALALADKGTLFLDEIGELPLPLQAQLLRALQERTYKRVGGNTWRRSEFRLICATNRNLEEEVRQGRFRADLFYRLAGLVCTLPPLRERSEDILPLARHFISELCPGQEQPEMDEAVREYFLRHDYPGNVRELKQRVLRLMHRHAGGGILSIGCIPPNERAATAGPDRLAAGLEQAVRRALAAGQGLKEIGQTAEDLAVRIAVEDAGGSLQKAAQMLGVTDRALQLRRAKEKQARAAVLMMPPARSVEAGCRRE